MQPAPLLSISDGLAAFHSFLQSEFSDENIEFWMSCEDFKKTKNPVKRAAKAKKIYEDFIQADGPKEVGGASLFAAIALTWNSQRSSGQSCGGPYMVVTSSRIIRMSFIESELTESCSCIGLRVTIF